MNIDKIAKLAKILIWMGVLAWTPCMYLKYIAHQHISMLYFLPFHLIGVLGGGGLKWVLKNKRSKMFNTLSQMMVNYKKRAH